MVMLSRNIEKYLQSRKRIIRIAAPMVLGLLFMFLCIPRVDHSLSLNEAHNALLAKSEPAMLIANSIEDGKSPIYIATLKLWAHCFGYTDFAMRMLSVISGALIILVCYIFLEKRRGLRVAILVSFLMATSPVLVFFGARVNACNLTLLGIALIFAIAWSIFRRRPKKTNKKQHRHMLALMGFVSVLAFNIVGFVFVYNLKAPDAKDIYGTITALDGGSNTAIIADTEELYYVLAFYANRPVYDYKNIGAAMADRSEIWQVTIIDAEGKPRTSYEYSGWRVAEYSTMNYKEQSDTYVIVKLEKE